MEIFLYRQGAHSIEEGFSAADLPGLLSDLTNVVWVDFLGDTDEKVEVARHVLAEIFHFHPLTIEDCIETRNAPKVEAFPDYFYFIVHGIKPEETHPGNFITSELDGYLGPNYVVTFHLERFRSVKDIKQKVRSSTFACERGAAYLLHQILDNLVDLYMPIVDDFDTAINELEERVFQTRRGYNILLEEIMDLRRAVARMKRISARQLEVLYRISHGEFPQIPASVLPFYRDVHDHLLRISDLSENYRDLISGLMDIHLSVIANRTNDVMKLLAIFSAIMLPLSLIAGIYGMNFENMPELKTQNGYYMTLGLMLLIALLLMVYFWRKGWIFQPAEDDIKSDLKKQ
jgi:magnesium transporter